MSQPDIAARLGFTADLESSPEIQELVQEASVSTQEAQELARTSLDFLAAIALPSVFRYFFPDVFQQIWKLLLTYVHKERDFSQIAIGLPRGFAKTTFMKIFLLYVILFTKRNFILVCANSVPKAVAVVSDVCDFLDEPNIKKLFGDWRIGLEKNDQVLKKFGFRGRNMVIAAGTVESVRGLNVKHQRPDVMLFDDIQSKTDAESQVISEQIESDLIGTAMKAKSPHGCLFVFVGNMYPTKFSILRHLKANPTWIKFIAGGILRDASGAPRSLWEDLQPLTQLLKEFENDSASGRAETFYAEVLNDENASVSNICDINKIPQNPYAGDSQHQGNFIIIDPSNDKANSDAVSIGYYEVFDSIPVCKEIVEGRLSPGDTIRESLRIALKRNCRVICPESNAYQYSLLYWFGQVIQQLGLANAGFQCLEIYSGQRSKNSRILDMFKSLLKGEILLADEARPATFAQITSFNPLKTNNVDGVLDLHTYAPKVLELYGEYIRSTLVLDMQETDSIPVRSELETSPF